jgi:hypothetical protein
LLGAKAIIAQTYERINANALDTFKLDIEEFDTTARHLSFV